MYVNLGAHTTAPIIATPVHDTFNPGVRIQIGDDVYISLNVVETAALVEQGITALAALDEIHERAATDRHPRRNPRPRGKR